jgi:hypothetical protein
VVTSVTKFGATEPPTDSSHYNFLAAVSHLLRSLYLQLAPLLSPRARVYTSAFSPQALVFADSSPCSRDVSAPREDAVDLHERAVCEVALTRSRRRVRF